LHGGHIRIQLRVERLLKAIDSVTLSRQKVGQIVGQRAGAGSAWAGIPHANSIGRYFQESIVMVAGGAGWHKSKSFAMPANLKLLFLPPYSLELNPQEHIRDELREKCFHHKTFDSLDLLEDQLVESLKDLETQNSTVKSIAG
jgi:DDE superfamily endonuclease